MPVPWRAPWLAGQTVAMGDLSGNARHRHNRGWTYGVWVTDEMSTVQFLGW